MISVHFLVNVNNISFDPHLGYADIFIYFPVIVESVPGAILCFFFCKANSIAAEHMWPLIVFVIGLNGVWLMQNVKNQK